MVAGSGPDQGPTGDYSHARHDETDACGSFAGGVGRHAYRYPVSVANGQIRYAGDASLNMAGTVAPDGAVRVSIRLGNKGANGSGQLTTNSGTGTWHGSGPNVTCAGRWEAARR